MNMRKWLLPHCRGGERELEKKTAENHLLSLQSYFLSVTKNGGMSKADLYLQQAVALIWRCIPGKKQWAVGEGASEVKELLCWFCTCSFCSKLLCIVGRWCLKFARKGLSHFVLDCAPCVSCQGNRLGFGRAAGECSLWRKGRDWKGREEWRGIMDNCVRIRGFSS